MFSSYNEFQYLWLFCRCRYIDARLKKKPNRGVYRELILSISLTKQWRDVLTTIESQRNAGLPMGKPPVMVYKILIAKAFSEDDQQLGWKLLNEVIKENILPDSRVFSAYWSYCSRFNTKLNENLEKMIEFIKENNIIVQKEVIDGLANLIESAGHSFKYVKITER